MISAGDLLLLTAKFRKVFRKVTPSKNNHCEGKYSLQQPARGTLALKR